MTLKRIFRNTLEFCLANFAGNYGKGIIRLISHKRDGGHPLATPWEQLTSQEKNNIPDLNIPLTDHYCPICNKQSDTFIISDKVQSSIGVTTRKVLHTCKTCGFLFTNEKREQRDDYFTNNPYACNSNGIRSQREVDLAKLGVESINGSKKTNILIYAVGKNTTVKDLHDELFINTWGSDISSGVAYDKHIINLAESPNFFEENKIKFDVIVACEVWEHYTREDINPAFEWLFNQLTTNGILVGSTGLWMANKQDHPIYNAPHEYGLEYLNWWPYPYDTDHTSFYRPCNLESIGLRNKMITKFAYFSNKNAEKNDPSKSIIAFTNSSNHSTIKKLESDFSNKRLGVFYS